MPRRKKVKGSSESSFLGPKQIVPKTKNQALLLESISKNIVTIAIGPAGCGKTLIGISAAVQHLYNGDVKKIVLTRPTVEMGHSLGALPGSYEDKLAPLIQPLMVELGNLCTKDMISNMDIDIVPFNYMRGRTFKNSFVVIDEAQNCDYKELVTALTRLGENSFYLIAADPSQSDLPKFRRGGIIKVVDRLQNMDSVAIVKLGKEDIVRHELVGRMLERLELPEDKDD